MNERIKIVLNELMETSRDGEKGFTRSAEGFGDPELKAMFLKQGKHCADAARELGEQLRMLGGEVEDGGSVSGAFIAGG